TPWPLRRAVRLACPESRSPCRLGRRDALPYAAAMGCLKNKRNLEAVAVSINIPPLPGFSAKLITIVSIFAFQILVALDRNVRAPLPFSDPDEGADWQEIEQWNQIFRRHVNASLRNGASQSH